MKDRGVYARVSIDTLHTGGDIGCYIINSSVTTEGLPADHWGILIVSGVGGSMTQMFYDIAGKNNPLYFRVYHNGAWDDWKMNYDSSILTNSAILSPLASALKPYL